MAPVCDSQHMFMQPSSAEPTSAAADSPVQNEFAAEILSSVAIHWSAPSIQGLATIVSCPSCGICNCQLAILYYTAIPYLALSFAVMVVMMMMMILLMFSSFFFFFFVFRVYLLLIINIYSVAFDITVYLCVYVHVCVLCSFSR